MTKDKQVAEITRALVESTKPHEWISFIFDLQNSLIRHNHLDGYTLEGTREFACRFGEMKNFFEAVRKSEEQ